MALTGKCICGSVSYRIDADKAEVGACHCSVCRRFSGGVFFGLEAKPDEVTLKGEENLTRYASSEWAERGFCKTCGASLFYRLTVGPLAGVYHFGAGTLDDWGDLKLGQEIFTTSRPGAFALAGDHQRLSDEETLAMFAKFAGDEA